MTNQCNYHKPLPYQEAWKSFIKKKESQDILISYSNLEDDNKIKVLARNFELNIIENKLIAYLSKTLYFTAINFDKKENQYSSRNQLIIDHPTIKFRNFKLLNREFEEDIMSSEINNVIDYSNVLSDKQKVIINKYFYEGYNDREIGELLQTSQQSIARSRKNALLKLKNKLLQRL